MYHLVFHLVKFIFCICLHRKAQDQQKKVVLAGCVPQAQPRMDYLKGLSIIGVCMYVYMFVYVDLYERGYLTNMADAFIRHIPHDCMCPFGQPFSKYRHTDCLTCHSPGCHPAASAVLFCSLCRLVDQ